MDIIWNLPEGVLPIHISVIGSRAKGYSSDKSDYEINMVVMHREQDYVHNNV